MALYRQAKEPKPTVQPAGEVIYTPPCAISADRAARSSGCADRSDEQSERDADCDREQHGHDDENYESEHHRRVALGLPVSLVRTMTAS